MRVLPYISGAQKAGHREMKLSLEAVVKQVRTTRHPWLIACDANMCPEDFKKDLWFKNRHLFIEASGGGISACRSKGAKRMYDYFSPVEDFESRPNKAVAFLAERNKEIQDWRELKMPEA